MGKKTETTGFRVVIEPRRLGDFCYVSVSDSFVTNGHEDMMRQYKERCEEIISDIARHVDNVGSAYIEEDTESICEHCGSRWTEAESDYNGGCCDEDQKAQDNREGAET